MPNAGNLISSNRGNAGSFSMCSAMRPNGSSTCQGVARMMTIAVGAQRVSMSFVIHSQTFSRMTSDSASSLFLKKSSTTIRLPPLPVMDPPRPR